MIVRRLRENAGAKTECAELDGIATRHGLTVDASSDNGNRSRITTAQRWCSQHHIEIEVLAFASNRDWREHWGDQARLAILLDDFGNDLNAADAIFCFTCSNHALVLPYKAHSQEIDEKRGSTDGEVMLHLPMQSGQTKWRSNTS